MIYAMINTNRKERAAGTEPKNRMVGALPAAHVPWFEVKVVTVELELRGKPCNTAARSYDPPRSREEEGGHVNKLLRDALLLISV